MLIQSSSIHSLDEMFGKLTFEESKKINNKFNAIKNVLSSAKSEMTDDEDLFRICVIAEKALERCNSGQGAVRLDRNKEGTIHSVLIDFKRKTYAIFLNRLGMIQGEGGNGKVKSVIEVFDGPCPGARHLVKKTTLPGQEISNEEVMLMQKYQQGVHKVAFLDAKGKEKTALMAEAFDNDLCKTILTRGFAFKEKVEILCQLAEQIFGIHENNDVHNDLKLENILLRENSQRKIEVQISDFGSANPDGNMDSYGTGIMTSPEVFKNFLSKRRHVYTLEERKAHDMYAMGIVAFEIINGHEPSWFKCDSISGTIDMQEKVGGKLSFFVRKKERNKMMSNEDKLNYFVARLLDPQPERRMTSKQFYEEIAELRDAA